MAYIENHHGSRELMVVVISIAISFFMHVGDEAFVRPNNFLSLYFGRDLGPWKGSFNHHISQR